MEEEEEEEEKCSSNSEAGRVVVVGGDRIECDACTRRQYTHYKWWKP